MSNTLQPSAKAAMLAALLATGTLKAQLIDTGGYTYSAGHTVLADVPSGARIGAPVALTGVTTIGGVLDAADTAFSGLSSAPTIEALWLYIDTGDESTSTLVYWLDTASGLPIGAGKTGGTVAWDNGANKIFKL